jgi:capsular polysaccharide export protein
MTPRRTRKRSLDELVAASLILYPTYVSRSTGSYATPERILDELQEWRTIVPETVSLWQKLRRRVLRWV